MLVSLDDGAAFVPLAGATVEERAIRVDQDAERVPAAPRPEAGETLSVADEKRLYEHYGLEYSQAESSTVLPEGATTEERPRLRKYIGAPVAAPAEEEPTAEAPPSPTAEEPEAADEPTAGGRAEAGGRVHGPAQPQRRHALPLPPRKPEVLPPQGGFVYEVEESRGSSSAPRSRSRSPARSRA